MAYLSGLLGVVDSNNNAIEPVDSTGTVIPPFLRIGDGLSAVASQNGAGYVTISTLASSYATTTSAFTQPANTTDQVTVSLTQVENVIPTSLLFIEAAGYYTVVSVNTTTKVVAMTLYSGIAGTGATVSTGKRAVPAGAAGPSGSGSASGVPICEYAVKYRIGITTEDGPNYIDSTVFPGIAEGSILLLMGEEFLEEETVGALRPRDGFWRVGAAINDTTFELARPTWWASGATVQSGFLAAVKAVAVSEEVVKGPTIFQGDFETSTIIVGGDYPWFKDIFDETSRDIVCSTFTAGGTVFGWGVINSVGSSLELRVGTDQHVIVGGLGGAGVVQADSGGALTATSSLTVSGTELTSIDGKIPAAAAMSAFVNANRPATPAFLSQHSVANGSATQLSANQTCTVGAWIQALSTNTASVFVGASDVSATKGWELTPGSSDFFPNSNLNQLYSFASATGQKLNIRYV